MSEYDETPEPGVEPDFDDPSYADVRALLAVAKVDAPIPAAVAAELDETLANLVAQRAKETSGATVVPLRRTWPSRFLVAASTVVLLGAGAVGLAQVVGTGDSDRTSTNADSSVARELSVEPEVAGGSATVAEAPDALIDNLTGLALSHGEGTLPRFSAKQFDQQVTDFVTGDAGTSLYDLGSTPMRQEAPPAPAPVAGDPVAPAPEGDQGSTTDPGSPGAGSGTTDDRATDATASKSARSRLLRSYTVTSACPGPQVIDGSTVIRIRYADRPATLVVRPAADGERQVEAWTCDGSRRLASTTVPAT